MKNRDENSSRKTLNIVNYQYFANIFTAANVIYMCFS